MVNTIFSRNNLNTYLLKSLRNFMTYTINFSSNKDSANVPQGKDTFTLQDRTTNKTSTSLILHGLGISPFGQEMWQNQVWLLENFCSSSSPTNPTVGQLWYDSGDQVLKIYKQVTARDTGITTQDWFALETSTGGSQQNLSTDIFLKDENGRILNDSLEIAGALLKTINLEVSSSASLKDATVSGELVSTLSSDKHNGIANSDQTATFDLHFITKKFADDYYLKGIHSNDNEFDASGAYNKRIIMPSEVHLTGTMMHKDNVIVPSGATAVIDIASGVFSIGGYVHVKDYKGSSASTKFTINLPCAKVRTGHTVIVRLTYFTATGGDARSKPIVVWDTVAEKEIMWAGGTRPIASATGEDVFEFTSIDGQWLGKIIGQGYSTPTPLA